MSCICYSPHHFLSSCNKISRKVKNKQVTYSKEKKISPASFPLLSMSSSRVSHPVLTCDFLQRRHLLTLHTLRPPSVPHTVTFHCASDADAPRHTVMQTDAAAALLGGWGSGEQRDVRSAAEGPVIESLRSDILQSPCEREVTSSPLERSPLISSERLVRSEGQWSHALETFSELSACVPEVGAEPAEICAARHSGTCVFTLRWAVMLPK